MKTPDVYDKNQPHHILSRENEYGDTYYYCNCGKTQLFRSLSDYRGGGLRRPLHEHVLANFDGRCHFKRYKMECGRFYGHRGIHRVVPPKKKPSGFLETLRRAKAKAE